MINQIREEGPESLRMAASLAWLKANLGTYKTTRYEGKTRIKVY